MSHTRKRVLRHPMCLFIHPFISPHILTMGKLVTCIHSFAFCLHFGLWEPSRPANYYYILLYIIIIIIDDATDRVGTERFGDTQGEGLVERWYGVTATTGSR